MESHRHGHHRVRSPVPTHMVAALIVSSSLLAGGPRINPRALGPPIVPLMMADSKLGANVFPLFPEERPNAETILKWLEAVTSLLTADESALIGGLPPRSLLIYAPVPVPAPLVVAAGITESAVATRDALIFDRQDANATKAIQEVRHMSEIQNNWFKKFQIAFRPNAPLLLQSMERDFTQAAPHAMFFSGLMAWQHITALGQPAAMMPGESELHDAHMIALMMKPLGSSATPQEFSQRVLGAIRDHLPYLSRPYATQTDISMWVIKQVPVHHGVEARTLWSTLTVAQKANPSVVASKLVEMMALARDPLELFKSVTGKSSISEFVGIASDESGESGGNGTSGGAGRRPRGLEQKGKGKGNGRDGKAVRPTACSTLPPRGPTCNKAHGGPCWRDPAWKGPLPARVAKIPDAVKSINADRIAQAARLGETCIDLELEDVLILDVVECFDCDMDQWPKGVVEPVTSLSSLEQREALVDAKLAELKLRKTAFDESSAQNDRDERFNVRLEHLRSRELEVANTESEIDREELFNARLENLHSEQVKVLSAEIHNDRLHISSLELELDLSKRQIQAAAAPVDTSVRPAVSSVAGDKEVGTPHVPPPAVDDNRAERIADSLRDTAHFIAPFLGCILILLVLPSFALSSYFSGVRSFTVDFFGRISGILAVSDGGVVDIEINTDGTLYHFIKTFSIERAFFAFVFTVIPTFGWRVIRAAQRLVNQHTVVAVLVIFIWTCVVKASATAQPCDASLYDQQLLPDVIHHMSGSSMLTLKTAHANLQMAHVINSMVTGTALINFTNTDELVAVLGDDAVATARVWDSGARRHVVRDSSRMISSTIKPCNFRVRGINTGGRQPKCMGDVEEYLPLEDGTVRYCLLKGVVCIEESPHDIISPGLLEEDGFCSWTGRLVDGQQVLIENHRFLVVPKCTVGQTTHGFCPKVIQWPNEAVLNVNDTIFSEYGINYEMVRAHDGSMVNVALQPPSGHWSKTVFAGDLREWGKQGVIKRLRCMKADFDFSVANGPDDAHGGAKHYLDRGPAYKQFIDESDKDAPVVVASHSPVGLLYWFSGTNFSATGMSSCWLECNGGDCVRRETKVDPMDSILSDLVFNTDVAAVRSGKIKRGLFSVPCNTFSVSKFRPHARIRPVRDSGHILMLPNLVQADQAKAKVANILVQRTCDIARELSKLGGVWIIENPVRRNDSSGPWKRFDSGKFPKHGSLFQMPAIISLAHDVKAKVAHVPLCWFAHERADICDVEQKYITLMYSPELEPALAFLHHTRCEHLSHNNVAVGFAADGTSLGERTSAYPAELNRVLARALAFPNHSASDAAWSQSLAPTVSPRVDHGGRGGARNVSFRAQVDDIGVPDTSHAVLSTMDVADVPLPRGIAGDRQNSGDGARIARGHTINMRHLSSRQVHETWLHKPGDVLRGLPQVCSDVSNDWKDLRDYNDTCPDCLAGKHTHFGSNSHLPETTKPGAIVAFDLLILRTPDIFTGGTICFGAIDLYSDWDLLIKIKHKSDVPDCIREVLQVWKSYGHNVLRMHTDGEVVFHSSEVRNMLRTELGGVGCLLTTGADYDHRQNSKIERHFRRLADDARPGFLQSLLDDRYYQCALVDASSKHKLLPLGRLDGQSPTTLFTGKLGKARPYRPFGLLAYARLEHEVNDSTTALNKSHARAESGILLSYGVTGVLHDRHVPGWVLFMPALRRNVPFVSPHVTVVLDCYPGVDGLKSGLDGVLRTRSDNSGDNLVQLDADDEGVVSAADVTTVPRSGASVADSFATEADSTHHAAARAPDGSPTIAQRLSRHATTEDGAAHPHEGSHRVRGSLDFDAAADDVVSILDDDMHPVRRILEPTSLHSSLGGTDDPVPFSPTLDDAPWLCSPRGGDDNCIDEHILLADLDAEHEQRDELVFLCDDNADNELRPLLHRHISQEAPRRVVRFAWGDVPTPWVDGYSTMYDTGIDNSVFVMDECVLTSLTEDDDPTWDAAIKGNESQKWENAAWAEDDNLSRFGVYVLVAADLVPYDEDIFDTMLLCKKKRGVNNTLLKCKVRCVLCGNQVVASAKRGVSKTTVNLRTHSPAVRAPSLKMNFAVGVLDDLRMQDFDFDAAYLQGHYVDRRVFARAPLFLRKYDERGVEYVWQLQRALYGGPDSGRVWYNTFAHYMMKEETVTPFQRCHFEPCAFTHFIDGKVDVNGAPQRIVCVVYVDDGRTWDNCKMVCDGFYTRLQERFSLTFGGGSEFMIGMDITLGKGWLKITSSTYIMNMCQRWLKRPIAEYDHVSTPTCPKLMDLYEAAVALRGNTPQELSTRYKSLVGGLIFPAPTTRIDCLFAVGMLARAMDCATEDMYNAAMHTLVYMGQTHTDGLTYLRHAIGGRKYVHWSDSDWSVRRSTSGGSGQLAGASVQATSRKQDCTSGSSTHAEIIAASSNANDVVWARGFLREIGLPQDDPTIFNVDANNVLTLVYNLIASKMTRHINRRELIVRERQDEGHLHVTKVPTLDNLADLFTKALPSVPFTYLRKLLMNILVVGIKLPVPRARRLAAKS